MPSRPERRRRAALLAGASRPGDTGPASVGEQWKSEFAERQRLSLDLFAKHGRENAGAPPVNGGGLALTWDFRDYFVRVARDRKVNFSADDQTRIALGWRF
jgi:hypothetical protein